MSKRGGKVKDSDILKTVKENNRTKFLKLLSSERTSAITKVGVKDESSIPGGRIRLKLSHVNLDCHEEGTGYTPLIIAVLNGYKDIAEDLVFHSADVNKRDNKGNSALHMAVFNGKIDMVDLLIQSRAKMNQQNSDGNSPLHITCQTDHEHRVHIMLKLLQAGANTKLQNISKKCPLDIAAMFNKADAVSVLLDHDSSLKSNKVAITEAAIRGYINIVELLLDYGIDPNGLDDTREMPTTPLIEATRFHRFDVAETLLKYGANPGLRNAVAESPVSMAKLSLPEAASKKFTKMFEEYKDSGATVSPRFLKVLSRGASSLAQKDYPELPNVPEWTRNTPEYCNSCTPNCPNTNILDADLCKCWIAAEVHHAWTVLDLKHNHTITGLTIYGWDSPQMVKSFELQKGNTLEGPWSSVMTNKCIKAGSQKISEPGQPQTFTDFTSMSRYWRLELIDNYGGNCICIHGIRLFGADERIQKLLEENNLDNYTDEIIGLGYNTYKKFLLITDDALQDIVKNDDERRTILKSLERDRPKEFHPVNLLWHTPPMDSAVIGETVPPFIVKSSPGVKTQVQLFVEAAERSDIQSELLINSTSALKSLHVTNLHSSENEAGCSEKDQLRKNSGKCVQVDGNTVVTLQSDSLVEPSIAVFSGISFNTAGSHMFKIRCVDFPRVCLEPPKPIDIKRKAELRSSVAMAFDDMEAMLSDLQKSLEPVGE